MDNVAAYHRHNKSATKYEAIRKALSENKELLRWGPAERILDAGCGLGNVTVDILQPLLPPDFRLLLGVDISHSMIAHAQNNFADDKVAFTTLDIEAEISHLTVDGQHLDGFEKIFSFFVLHWVSDIKRCIKNISSLLTPGGEAFLFFPVDRRFQKTYQEVRSMAKWKDYFKDVKRSIPSFPLKDAKAEFKKLAFDAGLKVLKIEEKSLYSDYDSMEHFKDLVESLDPDLSCVPVALTRQYLTDCLKVIEDSGVLEVTDRGVVFKQATLLCILRK